MRAARYDRAALVAAGRAVDAGALRLHVWESGQGPPLVLIHGFAVSHLEYRKAIEALATRARVIALDLPGHGESDAPAGHGYTYESFAETVAAAMTALGVPRAMVVGHSMCGGVALQLAAAHPDRVARLVLCDAACVPLALPLEGRIPLLPGIGRLLFRFLFGPRDLRRYFVRQVYADPAALDEELLEYYWRRLSERRESVHRALRTVAASGALAGLYGSVACPTLVLWGERDRIFPLEQGRALAGAIRGAQLEVLSGCGHSPPEEQPDRFVSAVLGFLR
jgi:pimeloyl-ACP methyl ester carboxylesterase